MCMQKVTTYPAPLAPEQFNTKLDSFDRWLPQSITILIVAVHQHHMRVFINTQY